MTIDNPPDWFQQAINTPFVDRWIDVENCPIHYQMWSEEKHNLPGLIFVHGHGAHAHWWDFIAPYFMDDYRVVALDVSGAGDSSHRESYSSELFAKEIDSVAEAAGFHEGCTLIGHSFGGRIARYAGHLYPERFAQMVLVDSAISLPGTTTQKIRLPKPKPTRLYPSQKEAARRFRLRPPQPCDNKFIVDYIAKHSVKEVEDGWCWKLDQGVFSRMADLTGTAPQAGIMIRDLKCPVRVIYGNRSRFFNADVKDYLASLIGVENMIPINNAYHHLFLDQPLIFIRQLKKLLDSERGSEIAT